MMEPNDWNTISEELEGIKSAAFHAGYEKAIEDFGKAKTDQDTAVTKLREDIHSWHRIIYKVQQTWAKHTNQEATWLDPSKDKYRYQSLFPVHHEKAGDHFVNVPDDIDQFVMAMNQCIKMAADFQTLLDAFDENPVVRAQWDRVLVAMRITK